MDIQSLINDLKLFLKENKKTIMISTVLVLLVAVAMQLLSFFFFSNRNNNAEEVETAVPAEFEVYIEHPQTGQAFTNNYLIEVLFESEEMTNTVRQATGVNIGQYVEEHYEEFPEASYGDLFKPLTSDRNGSTSIVTFKFNLPTEQESLAVAEEYYRVLTEGQPSFLNDKAVYTIAEPGLMELNENEMLIGGRASTSVGTFSLTSLITTLMLSLVGGIVLGVAISLLRVLINKKILYGFSYSWNEEDIYLNYSDESSVKQDVLHSILYPSIANKVIVVQDKTDAFLSEIRKNMDDSSSIEVADHIAFISPKEGIDEFVFIIKRKETTKAWYNEQRKLLKNYPTSSVKIVQV